MIGLALKEPNLATQRLLLSYKSRSYIKTEKVIIKAARCVEVERKCSFSHIRESGLIAKLLAQMYRNGDKFENVEICFSQNLVKRFLSKGISFHPSGDVHVAGRGEDGRYE